MYSPLFWLGLSFVWYFVLYLIRFNDFEFWVKVHYGLNRYVCARILYGVDALAIFPPQFFILASMLLGVDQVYKQKFIPNGIPMFWNVGLTLYCACILNLFLTINHSKIASDNVWVVIAIVGVFSSASILSGIVYGGLNIHQRCGQKLLLISMVALLISWFALIDSTFYYVVISPGHLSCDLAAG